MPPSIIRVAIVEDLDEVRQSLRETIEEAEGLTCANDYSDGEAALPGLLAEPPDVVVMDIGLPGMSGIECMLRVKLKNPDIRIMMFTIFDQDQSGTKNNTTNNTLYNPDQSSRPASFR